MDHLCILCLVFVMLSSLFIADLWSPKVPTSWLLFVMFIVILLLSHLVSLDRYVHMYVCFCFLFVCLI